MTEKINDEWQTPKWLFDKLNEEFNFDIDLCATYENSKLPERFCKDYLSTKLEGNVGTCFMNPPYSDPKPFIEKTWKDSKHCKIVCLMKVDTSTKWWATFWAYNEPCYYCDRICPAKVDINKSLDNAVYSTCPICYDKRYYNGPKPGCDFRPLPKRVKFDPPQQLIDSGEVWKVKNKWVQKCKKCCGGGVNDWETDGGCCPYCNGKGYKELSGPTFSSALLIFDRRGL